jgi:hypothetical protein
MPTVPLPTLETTSVSVLPAHSTVAGKTIGQWTAEWWKWAAAFPTGNDPISDTTGQYANLNQSGPVFFVAATGGESAKTYTVPKDKYVLIPLLDVELSQLELGFDTTPQEVQQAATGFADLISGLHATIDGQAVPNLSGHREASGQFSFVLAAQDNPVGIFPADPNTSFPAASGAAFADGYWLMLAPFKGQHTINFGGAIPDFDFSINATHSVKTTGQANDLNSTAGPTGPTGEIAAPTTATTGLFNDRTTIASQWDLLDRAQQESLQASLLA